MCIRDRRGTALFWAGILLTVALGLKFGGAYLGAKLAGLTSREGVMLGAGLNARGALEIIIATVGLSLGVFNQTSFTIIVMIPIVTSLFASIGLRLFGRDLEGSVAERERLAREEALSKNLLIRNNRILLPSDSERNSIVAAQVVHFAWPEDLAATVMAVGANGSGPDREVFENVLFGRQLEFSDVRGADAEEIADEIVAQSRLGYGVIAVGVVDQPAGGSLLSPVVDEVLKRSQLPVVVVRKASNHPGRLPGAFAQAVVPVVATTSSRAAQELAANMSAQLGTRLMLTHVIYNNSNTSNGSSMVGSFASAALHTDTDVADRILAQAHAHAAEVRGDADTEIRFASSPAEEIVSQAAELEADLIVLGAQLRRLDDGNASLGPNAEHVLRHAPQTVVAVVMPDERPE